MNSFRTEITPSPSSWKLDHSSSILMMGSCFAENIGGFLKDRALPIDLNPFGVLFNPVSIAGGLHRLLRSEPYKTEDLFVNQGLWHSFDHHSRFSGSNPEEVLEKINERLLRSKESLQKAKSLFITFGTARVYHHEKSGRVVSNCHKLPAKEFNYNLLRVGDVVRLYTRLLQETWQVNPELEIVFTVSPVRYWKDGPNGNQISKATLLLAVSELVEKWEKVSYFPAYEMFMDDLRDYRFYADDLLHPSKAGVDYVWQKFAQTYFDEKTAQLVKRIEKINRDKSHIPVNPETDAYQQFSEQLERKIESIKTEYPDIRFDF